MKIFITIIFCSLFSIKLFCTPNNINYTICLLSDTTIEISETGGWPENFQQVKSGKRKIVDWINKNLGEKKKSVAAILAFPVFGVVGLHRIYLGTKPYVPVIYIATLGGCLGIVPFIDFCTIIFADEETLRSYENNPKVLMWVK